MSTADQHETLHDWFLAVAQDQPDAVAIDYDGGTLSYRELADAATALAGWLHTVTPAERLGLVAHRDPRTYCLYLAILLAGRVVVPLSVQSPTTRLLDIIEAAGVNTVLTTDGSEPLVRSLARTGTVIHTAPRQPSGAAARVVPSVDQPAYILHTSGSTGTPKGVTIRHRQVLTFLGYAIDHCELGPGSRLSANFNLTFDLSLFDYFGAICSGGTMVLPRGRETLLPATYVAQRGLTHWYSVPSVISSSRNLGILEPGCLPGLRWSQFCGEPLRLDLARAWRLAAPNSVVENVYGPTETTLTCSQYRLSAEVDDWPQTSNGTVPIGEVYPHMQWRIRQPDSELLVRGPQRFNGYVDPAQTTGRFVDDDDQQVQMAGGVMPPSAWYRTGDRVSIEGEALIYRGRLDRQVKVRGHRVELVEIEHVLRQAVPTVKDVAAVVLGKDESATIGLAAVGPSDEEPELLRAAADRLPVYMVPSAIIWLESLPLGPTGKVDHVAIVNRINDR